MTLPEPPAGAPSFAEIGHEEVFFVTCTKCGSKAPVNMAYRPYIKSDTIGSCRHCRPVM